MTIEVIHYQGTHMGGTKEYSLYLFSSLEQKRALLVKRWGKVGAEGQVKIEVCKTVGNAELTKALSERKSKGYDMRQQSMKSYPTAAMALDDTIPASHQRAVWISQLAILEPQQYDASSRAAFDPMQVERDKMRSEMERKAAEKRVEEMKVAHAAEQAELNSNPLFGMF